MAELATPFRVVKEDATKAIDGVRSQADEVLRALDFEAMGRKIEDYGKQNPAALTLASLTIGVAVGMILKRKITG